MSVLLGLLAAAIALEPASSAARLIVDAAFIRRDPDDRAPIVGLLRAGDEVRVLGCLPARCDAPGAWAILDGGAIRASLLRPRRSDDQPIVMDYEYGRVRAGGAHVRAAPEAEARIVERHRAGQDLAFVPDPALAARGWLRRVRGGFVRADEIRPHTASRFAGAVAPTLPIVFAARGSGVSRLRTARAIARPPGIPKGARWVHVSLAEEVLVAYEDDVPVFATLVSTGLATHPTASGLFRVYEKEVHSPMHGDPPEPYFVDEVPFVQYFAKGMALHGTFWHDRFGRRASHGCVNLSMADARWLFDWAPPRLPDGWHAIAPEPAGLLTLWVWITPR